MAGGGKPLYLLQWSFASLAQAACPNPTADIMAVDFSRRRSQIGIMKFRVIIEPDEDGVFVAECPALPGCIAQGPTEQEALRNITEASQGIAQATINFVAQHSEALPGTFNIAEFNKDAALLAPFQQVASLIASLNTDTDDTLRALHSDIYSETLDVYAYAKAANRAGAYDDYINTVKTRFSTGPRPKKAVAKPTP